MPLLPPRKSFADQAPPTILADIKKGNKQALNDFVWQNQERFYAIAYLATKNSDDAKALTVSAFKDAMIAVKQSNVNGLYTPLWEWLSPFIVTACSDWHAQHSEAAPKHPRTDPTDDGSAQVDLNAEFSVNAQKLKRCAGILPEEQKKAFVLRHQLGLSYQQIAAVLNENADNVMAWLFRARVQIVKCLSR